MDSMYDPKSRIVMILCNEYSLVKSDHYKRIDASGPHISRRDYGGSFSIEACEVFNRLIHYDIPNI